MDTTAAGKSLEDIYKHAAAFIEETVRELALEYNLSISSFVWNLGQGFDFPGPHRLDLFLANTAIKVYFTDDELIRHMDRSRRHETKQRLRALLSELHDEALPIPLILALKRLAKQVRPY